MESPKFTAFAIYNGDKQIKNGDQQMILVVDDNKEVVRAIQVYLEQAGYEVLTAYDGATALHILRQEQPDLIVLDLMLPDYDGLDITRFVRRDATLKSTPIIMLTARVEDQDKIVGLEIGADDYITKPFNPPEVVARVRSVMRRVQRGNHKDVEHVLRFEELTLDVSYHAVKLDEKDIDLTRVEFDLLKTLMSSPGHVFTRSELIEQIFIYEYEGLERSLDTHIMNLRKKIESNPKQPRYIQTVYGIGYRLGDK